MAKTAQEWVMMTPQQIEGAVDIGLRHKTGLKPNDYLSHWLSVSRQFGYATHDDSWGEFEKEFAIIIRRLVLADKAVSERDATIARLREVVVDACIGYRIMLGEKGLPDAATHPWRGELDNALAALATADAKGGV